MIDDVSCKTWVYNRKYELDVSKVIDIKHVIQRGMARHVDNCPKNVRTFRGKSYANIHDNCCGCEYFFDQLTHEDGEDDVVFCGGKHKITSVDQLCKSLRITA